MGTSEEHGTFMNKKNKRGRQGGQENQITIFMDNLYKTKITKLMENPNPQQNI